MFQRRHTKTIQACTDGAKKTVCLILQTAQRIDVLARKLDYIVLGVCSLILFSLYRLNHKGCLFIFYSICRNDCTAVGRLAGKEGTDVYCQRKCLRYPSNCPKDECQCVEKIDPSDPSIVLDQSSNVFNYKEVTNYTNKNGHKVEEFQKEGGCR